MPTCPSCKTSERQVKAGLNRTGSQRLLCRSCGRSYTPEPKPSGYSEPVRRQALALYAGGMSVREAGRFAGVNHQTAANWVEAACALAKESEASGSPAGILIAQVAVRRALELQGRNHHVRGSRCGIISKRFDLRIIPAAAAPSPDAG